MKQRKINRILAKAQKLSSEKKKWHFHMLGKNCKFNQNKGKFTIVFENEEAQEVLFSVFEKKPLEESKKLADIMYGKSFLEQQEKDKHNPDFDLMFAKAKELTAKQKEWHHHHLHPNCIFNENKEKHSIILEDESSGETQIVVYDNKPMEDLVKIERLFYKDLKP